MARLYGLLILVAVLGGVAYGAKYYYDTTQNKIATLQKNNATLTAAAETAEASIKTLQGDIAKMATLNNPYSKIYKKQKHMVTNLGQN